MKIVEKEKTRWYLTEDDIGKKIVHNDISIYYDRIILHSDSIELYKEFGEYGCTVATLSLDNIFLKKLDGGAE